MDFDQLTTFVQVAKLKSFSKAGQAHQKRVRRLLWCRAVEMRRKDGVRLSPDRENE